MTKSLGFTLVNDKDGKLCIEYNNGCILEATPAEIELWFLLKEKQKEKDPDLNPNIWYILEYMKTGLDKPVYKVNTNQSAAKKQAGDLINDIEVNKVKLHRVEILKTWAPVASVSFEESER